MVLEKTLESLLDCKEIKPINPKGNQSRIFTGRTDAEAPVLWQPDARADALEKTLMLGGTGGRRRRGMAGWHHQLHEPECEEAREKAKQVKPGVPQSTRLQRVGHD